MSAQTLFRLVALLAATAFAQAQTVPLKVDTSSREEVRQFYRSVYFASEDVAMGWTGDYSKGAAGTTAAAYQEATRLRINFFRALAGVPAGIAFDSTYSAKAQQAALMLSANAYSKVGSTVTITLSHTPPNTWTFYTAEGAEGAAKSNIAYGNAGPDAVTAYMVDDGANNYPVGHRRWLLAPQTAKMGSGDVPGDGSESRGPANAIWINDGTFGSTRPATRTSYVAYPPAGYVPYTLVWPRWSFSLPNADFSATTVTMTRNGSPIAVALEKVEPGAAENTLVWGYNGLNPDERIVHPRPTADTTYAVTVSGVKIGGVTQSPYTYTVTVFDPDVYVDQALTAPARIATSSTPAAGVSQTFSVSKPAFSLEPSFQWRTVALGTFSTTYQATGGLDGLIATNNSDYTVVQSIAATSGKSYRLSQSHAGKSTDQYLQVPEPIFVSEAGAKLSFASRLGYVTTSQTARVQISVDDGRVWTDAYTQSGTSDLTNPNQFTETAFTTRTVSLSSYVNRTILVRFAFTKNDSGTAYYHPDATTAFGWFIDDVAFTGVKSAQVGSATTGSSSTGFTYMPTAAGTFALQARAVLFDAYPAEWGPVAQFTADAGVAVSGAYLFNLSVRSKAGTGAETLIAGFVISGDHAKKLVVRGIGPELANYGVSGVLADPKLEIHGSSIISNDSWSNENSEFTSLGGFPLTPGSKDAAIVTSLAPRDYTAQVSAADGGSGVALVELYDGSRGVGSKLINLSARTHVGVGEDAVFVGFNIGGTGKKRLLIRGVGPTLNDYGLDGAVTLANPIIELYDMRGNGPVFMTQNDDWSADSIRGAGTLGFPLRAGSKDAALYVSLDPGTYSVKVSGVASSTGIALVEVYDVP